MTTKHSNWPFKSNISADALSRRPCEECRLCELEQLEDQAVMFMQILSENYGQHLRMRALREKTYHGAHNLTTGGHFGIIKILAAALLILRIR